MQRLIFGAVVLVLIAGAVAWAQTGSTSRINEPSPPNSAWLTYITNWPDTQNVAGSVSVDNLPALQQVEVVNWPAPVVGAARFQLVGFTAATFDPSRGVFTYTAACQAEFPGSRMCILSEAIKTTTLPTFGAGTGWAWIAPGNPMMSTMGSEYGSCNGWTYVNCVVGGMALNRSGGYRRQPCDSVLSVACCAPVE